VVDEGRFVGSVARADICWGLLVEQPSRQLVREQHHLAASS
jgi:hypothetical protein